MPTTKRRTLPKLLLIVVAAFALSATVKTIKVQESNSLGAN